MIKKVIKVIKIFEYKNTRKPSILLSLRAQLEMPAAGLEPALYTKTLYFTGFLEHSN